MRQIYVIMDSQMIDIIREYFKTQPVEKAWLFGSYSRGEQTDNSDIDILVVFDYALEPIGLMRYAKMKLELEDRLGKDVDLVEEGCLLPFAVESANRDKKLIYERA